MALYKVEICGVDTSKLPHMSSKKSTELLNRIKEGDNEAREEFITGNLRLVLSVIQRFSNRGELADDMFQVGCIGLIKAIDNFDTSHGVKFSTYAVPMIIGELRRYLRDNNSLRVSRSLRDTAYKVLQMRSKMLNESDREPKVSEIAKALGIDEAEAVLALDAIQEPVSLFEPIYHNDGDAIFVMDQVCDEKSSEERWLDGIAIDCGLDKLGERERRILKLRFFDGKTQTEVAAEIGISQAQVSRLEKTALKTMRKWV